MVYHSKNVETPIVHKMREDIQKIIGERDINEVDYIEVFDQLMDMEVVREPIILID